MIRFSCPNCKRGYELPDALFGLPLVCKGCGQRLDVPAPQPDPEPPPPPPEPEPPPVVVVPPPPAKREPTAPTAGPPEPKRTVPINGVPAPQLPERLEADFLSPETMAKLDLPLEVSPTASAPQTVVPPVPQPPAAPKPWGGPKVATAAVSSGNSRKFLGIVVDVAVGLVLLAVGVFLGELAARQSTREILAGISGPKFPSLELLMWLAGPVVLLLIYALLGSRGKSVGGWLRRRGE